MSRDLVHLVRTHISKVEDVPRESAVRLYCHMFAAAWKLQVRGPLHLKDRSPGKDFIVATATLERTDMIALRNTIDAFLKEGQ